MTLDPQSSRSHQTAHEEQGYMTLDPQSTESHQAAREEEGYMMLAPQSAHLNETVYEEGYIALSPYGSSQDEDDYILPTAGPSSSTAGIYSNVPLPRHVGRKH